MISYESLTAALLPLPFLLASMAFPQSESVYTQVESVDTIADATGDASGDTLYHSSFIAPSGHLDGFSRHILLVRTTPPFPWIPLHWTLHLHISSSHRQSDIMGLPERKATIHYIAT